jgi:hypothetical protein
MDWSIGHALTLSRFYDLDGEIVLLDGLDARRLCHEGRYEAIDPWQAKWIFERNLRGFGMMGTWEIRSFVGNCRLSSFPVSEMDDHDLVELIEDGIKRGDLIAIKKVDPAVLANRPVDPAVVKLRLIREIEAKAGGKLTEAGRQYRLIRDIDFERFPERNYYHVVRQDEAKQILDAMANQPGTSAELAELFVKARDQLARDWNSFREPDGLILLRRAPMTRAPAADHEPPITPSQLLKLKLGWITIECVEESEEPWKGKLDIVFSDGTSRGKSVDAEGIVHIENIEPGDATVSTDDENAGP